MSNKISLQSSYIVHTRRYRDSSLLVEAFTQDFGLVSIIARGVQRPKSKYRGILQPFKKLKLSWVGKGDLYTLTDSEEVQLEKMLSGKSLYCGFYLNELITRLLHKHDPHPDLFSYYQTAIKLLASVGQAARTLRLFEKKLLAEIGYGLLLETEVGTANKVKPGTLYDYVVEFGPVVSATANPETAIHGASLLSLANDDLQDPLSLKECKNLMRTVLNFYLGNKPLKSRELLLNNY